ncbi:MAG: DUF1326 domain-containing protein [Acidobacteria bacterium]|nr:DUF1326 domain-containing protein [Acidobacteriota bacterium]
MKKLLVAITLAVLAAASTFAAAVPAGKIYGDYIEARTADVFTGACFANSEVGLTGELAVFGWRVSKGSWQGVALDGLSVAAAVRARQTLGDPHNSSYPVRAVLIVDSRANLEQRMALKSFAQKMGGDLLQDIVRVEYQPIELKFENDDLHSMKATFSAGPLASISTRAIAEGDHLCRNEQVWYQPLTKVNHAMAVFVTAHTFKGPGLGTNWSSPDKRSSFIANFVADSE